MSAKVALPEGTGGRGRRPMQQASVGKPVPDKNYSNQTPPALILSSKNSMQGSKFDGCNQLHLWSDRL